jgi:hypothetical protein
MKKLTLIFASIVLVVIAAATFVSVDSVGAVGAIDSVCEENQDSPVCQQKDDYTTGGFVEVIVNALLFITGAAAVVVIIIGGIQFVLSQGNSANVAKAKNTITYAVIGLVVAFLAYAIVNWVFDVF